MKKRWKKIVATMLTLSLIVASFVGCNKKDTTESSNGEPKTSTSGEAANNGEKEANPYAEPMEISISYWDIDEYFKDTKNDKLYQYLTEKFNFTVKTVNTTWDDYSTKIQTWAAVGTLPDIFSTDAIGTESYLNWTTQDVVRPLLPIEPEKYPNLAKYFETEDIKSLQDENGNYFCVPRRMYESLDWSALDRIVLYRWDIAQEAGVTKEPETWDEFKAMLAAINEKDPRQQSVTGLTTTTTGMLGGFFWLYSNPLATSAGGGFKWIKEDGKFIPAYFSKNSLESLKNMREMYEDGLINPDIALTNLNTAYDNFVSGKSSAVLIGGGFKNIDGAIFAQRWAKLNPDQEFTEAVKVLKPMVGVNGEYNHAVFNTYWSESYFSANVDDAKMERILAIYDYLISEEGQRLINYGFEGEDYTVDGDTITQLGTDLAAKYPSKSILCNLVAYNDDAAYDMNSVVIVDESIRQEAINYKNWILENTTVPKFYSDLTYVSTETRDTFNILDKDDLLNIMMSSAPVEDMWNDIIASYEAQGLNKMIEEVNAKAAEMGLE